MPKRKRVINIPPAKFVLQLYITGDTALIQEGNHGGKKDCQRGFKDNCRLKNSGSSA